MNDNLYRYALISVSENELIKHLWDTLIHEPIEIIGEGILEGKE